MKRRKYTEPQIVFAFQQAASGTPAAEIVRKMGARGHLLPLEEEVRGHELASDSFLSFHASFHGGP